MFTTHVYDIYKDLHQSESVHASVDIMCVHTVYDTYSLATVWIISCLFKSLERLNFL